MPDSTLELVPEDLTELIILDMQALISDEDLAESVGLNENILDVIEIEEGVGIDSADVSEFLLLEYLWVLEGRFQFDDIRDDLDDADYEESSYRGYEVWEGDDYIALLEEAGMIVYSPSGDELEDALGVVYRGRGSLADADAEDNDVKPVLDKLGEAPVIMAFGYCEYLRRCQGFGYAFTEYDYDQEQVNVQVAALFSSERAAEAASDDYNDVADMLEAIPPRFDVSGRVDIEDLENDGMFVVGQAVLRDP